MYIENIPNRNSPPARGINFSIHGHPPFLFHLGFSNLGFSNEFYMAFPPFWILIILR